MHSGFVARPLSNTLSLLKDLCAGGRNWPGGFHESFVFWPKPVVVLFKVYLCHFTDSQSMTGGKRPRHSWSGCSDFCGAQIPLIFHTDHISKFALGLMENQIWVVLFFCFTNLLQGWNRAKLWRKAQIAPAGQIWLIQGAWSLKARGIHQLLQIIPISCSRRTLGEKKCLICSSSGQIVLITPLKATQKNLKGIIVHLHHIHTTINTSIPTFPSCPWQEGRTWLGMAWWPQQMRSAQFPLLHSVQDERWKFITAIRNHMAARVLWCWTCWSATCSEFFFFPKDVPIKIITINYTKQTQTNQALLSHHRSQSWVMAAELLLL